MIEQRVWYRARLLPPAQAIFTEGFYPEPKRDGAQHVYFTQVAAAPTHQKVLVASRLARNALRLLTLDLARHCLDPLEKATRAESASLNELSEHLERNL